MLSFTQYLMEGNPLAKLTKKVAEGTPIGTVSPERGYMNSAQIKAAHVQMRADLQALSDAGMISYTGPHKGLYMYQAPKDGEPAGVAGEGSYLLLPGNHPEASQNFLDNLKNLGVKYGQESVLHGVRTGKQKRARGNLVFTTGDDVGQTVPLGSMYINQPLKQGTGETAFKNKKASFTFRKKAPWKKSGK